MNTIVAICGIVIKELYRRKDFYVLFVLTAIITLALGSVTELMAKHQANLEQIFLNFIGYQPELAA